MTSILLPWLLYLVNIVIVAKPYATMDTEFSEILSYKLAILLSWPRLGYSQADHYIRSQPPTTSTQTFEALFK